MATFQEVSALEAVSTVGLRKILTHADDVYSEGGRPLEQPLRRGVVAAVVANPWAGRGFVDDLWTDLNRVGGVLAELLTAELVTVMGGVDEVRGFGKCAVVGLSGEIEHGAAVMHGPKFGPRFRELVQGTAPIPFTERRAAPGTTVSIPTVNKTRNATRDYYAAVDLTLDDAPHADELVLALAAVSGPRPHARSGDLTTDAEWAARS